MKYFPPVARFLGGEIADAWRSLRVSFAKNSVEIAETDLANAQHGQLVAPDPSGTAGLTIVTFDPQTPEGQAIIEAKRRAFEEQQATLNALMGPN